MGNLSAQDRERPNLERLPEAVDRLFSDVASAGPGCAVVVRVGDRTVHAAGYGMADLSHGVPITPATAFKVASITKQFTGMAIALLERRGALSIDDPVRSHLPELPEYMDPVTLKHLLHHTSGVRDGVSVTLLAGRDLLTEQTRDDLFELITRQSRLNADPGTAMLYSNSGYFLLDEVVERVAGIPTAEFLRVHVFEPLEMSNTRVRTTPAPIDGLATEYAVAAAGVWSAVASRRIGFGSGNLVSTVEDLGRWGRELNRMVEPSSSRFPTLLRPGVLDDGREVPYGFGIWNTPYGAQRGIYHSGSTGYGFVSNMVALPDHDALVAVLCNGPVVATGRVLFAVARMIHEGVALEEIRPLAAVHPQRTMAGVEGWEGHAGRYQLGEQSFVLSTESDRVIMRPDRPQGGGAAVGVAISDTSVVFRNRGVTLAYSPQRPDGPITHHDASGFREAVRTQDASVPAAEREHLIGLYWSDDLDAALRVRGAPGAGLELVAGQVATRLVRMDPNRYTSSDGAVRFEVDADGTIAGLVIDSGRSKGVAARRVGR